MAISKKSLVNSSTSGKSTKAPKGKALPAVDSAKMVSAMRMTRATTAKANFAKATTMTTASKIV